jgi:hypothetical protein
VFEERTATGWRSLGAGVAAFVPEHILQELKRPPVRWFAAELVRRFMGDDLPVLSDRELSEQNTRRALNLIIWQNAVPPEDFRRADVANLMASAFFEVHRGFQVRECVVQVETRERLIGMRIVGALWLDPAAGHFGPFPDIDLEEFFSNPRTVGMTREIAMERPLSWFASLFLSAPPRFGFSRGEQRLLHAALRGGTDHELAMRLSISPSAVKKMWQAIYHRVAATGTQLIPTTHECLLVGRGKEKKQHLIAYLHAHPEELRPIVRSVADTE